MAAISSHFSFPTLLPKVPLFYLSEAVEKIREVAKSALAQLVVSFSVNVAFCAIFGSFFNASQHDVLSVLLAAALASWAIRAVWQRCYPHGTARFEGWDKWSGHLARCSLVNTLTLKLNRLIHEWGHAGAAWMTFIQANPEIVANCKQGSTSYAISYGLTPLGKALGEERALIFTTAAGLALPVLCAMAELARLTT